MEINGCEARVRNFKAKEERNRKMTWRNRHFVRERYCAIITQRKQGTTTLQTLRDKRRQEENDTKAEDKEEEMRRKDGWENYGIREIAGKKLHEKQDWKMTDVCRQY